MLSDFLIKKLNTKYTKILLEELDSDSSYSLKYKNANLPNFCEQIVHKLYSDNVITTYPTNLSIDNPDTSDYPFTISPERYNNHILFIILYDTMLKFKNLNKETKNIQLVSGSVIILTDDTKYGTKYKFCPIDEGEKCIVLTFTQIIPTIDHILSKCKLKLYKSTLFESYVEGLNPVDADAFLIKLNKMGKYELQKYLNELFDTTLEDFGDKIYKKKSIKNT